MYSQALPSRRRTLVLLCLPVAAACLVAVGCGEKLPPLTPVKGAVTVDGKKLTSGQVSLVPETPDPKQQVPPSSGKIDSDGNYEIFTGGKTGAPLGKYKVKVTPDMSMPSDKGKMEAPFDGKYLDSEKSKLGFEVVENAAVGRYDLKLTK